MTDIVAKCELCLADTEFGEYGVGLSEMGEDGEYADFEHKRLCRNCYLKLKLFILKQIKDNFRPKLDKLSKSLEAARLKMG